jgi:hypothetical protein
VFAEPLAPIAKEWERNEDTAPKGKVDSREPAKNKETKSKKKQHSREM